MKQKWWLIFCCLSMVFIITAYVIGLQQSATQLQKNNEQLRAMEHTLSYFKQEEKKAKALLKTKSTEQSIVHKETVKKLEEKIQHLERELESLKKRKETQKKGVNNNEKKVFLTFDDGPSLLTDDILTILDEKKVKATFFTVGTMMEEYPEIVKKTYDKGHMVLPHSYSHKYSIYSTFDSFYQDFNKVKKVYEQILGFQPPPFFRFPGGSSNQTSIKFGGKDYMANLTTDVKGQGFSYVDWNVIAGDTTSISNDRKKMFEQVKKGSENNDFVVALFHDIVPNQATADILPNVIDYYAKNGFTFRTFRDITEAELEQLRKRGIINKPIVKTS